MVIENRLKILASQIKVQKRKGFIHEWPEGIKNEAVLLMAEVVLTENHWLKRY